MSNRGPRNLQLLAQISDGNPFAKTLPRAFDIGHDLERDIEAIYARDANGQFVRRDLSAEGKKGEAQKAVRRALRDLRDVRKPVDEYHFKTKAMKAAATLPPIDKTDRYAAGLRREMRDRSWAMTPGQRAGHMTGPDRDPAFIDALLEVAPWMSGINIYDPGELEIYKIAKEERLRDLHGPLIDAAAAREGTESEAMMILNVVRGDIQGDSGLELREFEELAKPIETIPPEDRTKPPPPEQGAAAGMEEIWRRFDEMVDAS